MTGPAPARPARALTRLRPLRTHADVVAATGGHPIVQYDLADPLVDLAYAAEPVTRYAARPAGGEAPRPARADAAPLSPQPAAKPERGPAGQPAPRPAGVAWLRRSHRRLLSVTVLGGDRHPADSGVAALLRSPEVQAWVARPDVRSVTVPAGFGALAESRLPVGPGVGWDWMWTTEAPAPVDEESELEPLTEDRDQAAVASLLSAHSPGTHGEPFARPGQLWLGLRAPRSRLRGPGDGPGSRNGGLLAVGCSEPNPAGVPHLTGIAVHPSVRGRGLGAAVTARLTREALAECGVCTLAHYSDNDVARRLYRRLGYRTAACWSSHLVRRGPD